MRRRRRGGQELPDEAQDRPEQNSGYDAAVRGNGHGTPVSPRDDSEVFDLESGPTDGELIELEREADEDENENY